ncbi:MAG TPA: 4Fe-4S binding protein [Candidatus Bathyarchaeia archaeon]
MARLFLRFSEDIVEKPITAQIILEHKTPISIVAAHVNSQGGEILAEVPTPQVKEIADAFRAKGVTVIFPKLIEKDTEKCFDCGACFSLCPVKAITFGEDYSVVFDREKCIGSSCGKCVDACPARAIRLIADLEEADC